MFHKFTNRLTITGKILTTTAIHIGAAEQEFSASTIRNPFLRDAKDRPFIPGSSLKGVLRSFLERLLNSEGNRHLNNANPACTISATCLDAKDDNYNKLVRAQNETELAKYVYGKLCLVCRIFGSPVNGAKLLLRDSMVIEDTFDREFELRTGVAIDRDLNKNVPGAFYDFEVVPEGTEFAFEAIAENLDEQEWRCIKALLRAMELGLLQIGGMVSRGLGGIRLKELQISKIDATNLVDVLFEQAEPTHITLKDTLEEKAGGEEHV